MGIKNNHYLEDLCFEPLRLYLPFFLSLTVVFWGLSTYELINFFTARPIPENFNSLLVQTALYDALFALQLAAAVFPFYGLFHYVSYEAGNLFKVCMVFVIGVICFAITQYFVSTTVPLGADFWGYSFQDIKTTVGSSTTFSLLSFLLMLVLLLAPIFIFKAVNRVEVKSKVVGFLFLVSMVLSIVLNPWISAERRDYFSDDEFYTAENKSHFFASKSVDLLANKFKTLEIGNQPLYANSEFPLMHKMDYRDVLGPHMNITNSTPPNIVIIQVEGLGKSFVGKGAPKGGFTPFLDSLMEQSLHWDNFLSSAGRTFGILPSFYGSLPFNKSGFMEMGNKMPTHTSLIKMLRPQGYGTHFFYGGNAHFDNQDVFLEAEGVDLIVSEKSFPTTYKKMAPNDQGFTWGYGDKEVFQHSLEIINKLGGGPRLDIYMTLTTHEPFTVPEEKYKTQFNVLAANSSIDKEILNENRGVFECLLYTDDAIRELIAQYKSRPEFSNTIFIITGDHRMIPVPHESAIDRFHVPMIIWSPMLKGPQQFKGVGSHHNMAATLMGFLRKNYGLDFPASLPFIGGVIDDSKSFSSQVNQPIMRNKNDLNCYVMGEYYLTDGAVFKLSDGMELSQSVEPPKANLIKQRLAEFQQINKQVCEKNKLFNGNASSSRIASFNLSDEEQRYIDSTGISKLGTDDAFTKARELAFNKKYTQAQIVLRYILNDSPNYSDVRNLLARTYMWTDKYELARKQLKESIRRSPEYYDGYMAMIDCEVYANRHDSARYWYNLGMKNATELEGIAAKNKSIKSR